MSLHSSPNTISWWRYYSLYIMTYCYGYLFTIIVNNTIGGRNSAFV